MPNNRYKIQVPCVNGWADLLDAEDGITINPNTLLYNTKEEACEEAKDMMLALEDFECRVVTEDTPEDCHLYA